MYNPSSSEAEAEGSQIPSQPGPHSETQNKKSTSTEPLESAGALGQWLAFALQAWGPMLHSQHQPLKRLFLLCVFTLIQKKKKEQEIETRKEKKRKKKKNLFALAPSPERVLRYEVDGLRQQKPTWPSLVT